LIYNYYLNKLQFARYVHLKQNADTTVKFQETTKKWPKDYINCSQKECCKQCMYVKFKGTMTKWPVKELAHRTTQKHEQHYDATLI